MKSTGKPQQPLKRNFALFHGKQSEPLSQKKAKTQPKIREFFGKEPVLNLCAGMVVIDGSPFTFFNGDTMQLMIKLGKQGAGDDSTTRINGATVRERVQEEAELLRAELKKRLRGKVLHLSADMASRDGRCFLGNATFYLFRM